MQFLVLDAHIHERDMKKNRGDLHSLENCSWPGICEALSVFLDMPVWCGEYKASALME